MGRYTSQLDQGELEETRGGKELRRGGLEILCRQLLGGLFDWFPIISLFMIILFFQHTESVPNLTACYLL